MWKIRRNRKNSAKKIILLKILHLNFYMLIYVLKMCLRPGTDEIFIRMRDKVSSPHSHGIRYIGSPALLWKKIARKKSWDAQWDSDENENETELNQPERTPYSWKRSASAACNGKMCKKAFFHIAEIVPFSSWSSKKEWSRMLRELEEIWTGCRKEPLLMAGK